MINRVVAHPGRLMATWRLRAAVPATKALVRTRTGREVAMCSAYLSAALTAGFLATCGGLLAVIALRGYLLYG